jgi:heme/copper-type cytochrome/quinol oxidase subunit 2
VDVVMTVTVVMVAVVVMIMVVMIMVVMIVAVGRSAHAAEESPKIQARSLTDAGLRRLIRGLDGRKVFKILAFA